MSATAFKRLRQGFGLRDNFEVVLHREDLAHADAEDGFRIGKDDADRLADRLSASLRPMRNAIGDR